MATAELSKLAGILSAALSQHHLSGFETAQLEFHDLHQIPYYYTVEVRNRFKGLDLIDRVPDELSNEVHDIVQETGIKTIPMEKKCKGS